MLSILLIRPLLLKSRKADQKSEELENMYIGKIAKVVEPITKSSGTVTIFEERWDARLATEDAEDIPEGFICAEDTVALTAGASTPQWLLDKVAERITQMGTR
jgi:4-hydroxy-3-methylbut-2-enyl diphosphate reductase IspH